MKTLYTNRIWVRNKLFYGNDDEKSLINYLYSGGTKPKNILIQNNIQQNEVGFDIDDFNGGNAGHVLSTENPNPDDWALIYDNVNYIDEESNNQVGNYYRKIYRLTL